MQKQERPGQQLQEVRCRGRERWKNRKSEPEVTEEAHTL